MKLFRNIPLFVYRKLLLCFSLITVSAQGAVTLNTLYLFPNSSDGYRPDSGLVWGPDGAFYGTAEKGGLYGHGSIYRVTPQGSFSVIHQFTGTNDGADSFSPLVLGTDGSLYGAATGGGTSGSGTIFKLQPTGTPSGLTLLYSFTGFNFSTRNGLTMGTNGILYGFSNGGGNGFGFLFTITTNGAYHQFYVFRGTNDGSSPMAPLVEAADGNFYGTTQYGGISNYNAGLGTVFRFDINGSNFTSVAFTNRIDGANPLGGLVEGADGNLYGTAAHGGMKGLGTIFRVTPHLQLTTLYSFTDLGQGEYPDAALVATKDGFLYGLVSGDGTNSTGSIFRISTNGQFSILFQMNNTNGEYVVHSASLTQGTNGFLYGVTPYGGGTNSNGTIFSLNVPGPGSSLPSIVSAAYANGMFTFSYNSAPGSTYQILYSADLSGTNWTPIGPPTLATNSTATVSFTTPVNNAHGFYKFSVKP